MGKSGGLHPGSVIVKIGNLQIQALFVGATIAEIRDFINADGRVQVPPDTEPFVLTSDRTAAPWQAESGAEELGTLKLSQSGTAQRVYGWGKVVSEGYVIRSADFFLWFRDRA